MHMHTHLKSCVEDYGPSHGFLALCFLNATTAGCPNNNRSIEIQLMERFLCDQEVKREI